LRGVRLPRLRLRKILEPEDGPSKGRAKNKAVKAKPQGLPLRFAV